MRAITLKHTNILIYETGRIDKCTEQQEGPEDICCWTTQGIISTRKNNTAHLLLSIILDTFSMYPIVTHNADSRR
jgi:hypothetical protein